MDLPSIAEETERPCVSTGHFPAAETAQKLVPDSHRRFKSNTDGQNSQVYPALARVPSNLFGICVVGTSGRVYAAGDVTITAGLYETSGSRASVFTRTASSRDGRWRNAEVLHHAAKRNRQRRDVER
jgi:hypothetical protein